MIPTDPAQGWHTLSERWLGSVPATVGVFEIADAAGTVVDMGYGGGREPFGIRGAIGPWLKRAGPWQVRYEVTSSYLTRFYELAMLHRARCGELPPGLRERGERIAGELQP